MGIRRRQPKSQESEEVVRAPRVTARSEKPENQHYVPKFWLRLFGHGDGNGLIWACNRASGETTVRSVNKSAAGADYYSVDYPDAKRDMALEREFSKLERITAPFVRSLGNLLPGSYEVDAATRDLLATWIALSRARVPGTIDTTLAMAKLSVAVEVDMLLRNPDEYRKRSRAGGSTESDEVLEVRRLNDLEEHRERRLIIEPAPETGLTSLGIAVEHIRPIIAAMRFEVVRRNRFPYFILGDQPVTLSAPDGHPRNLGVGITTPGVEIYMPLSPEALLMLTHEPHDGRLTVISPDVRPRKPTLQPDWVLRPNLTAFVNASREVFGRSQGDVEAARLALDPTDRNFKPGIRISGLPKEWERYLPAEIVNEALD